jgi:hypothetical protein
LCPGNKFQTKLHTRVKKFISRNETAIIGTDGMILKIFPPKKFGENGGFFAETTASFCKHLIIALGFEKDANLFAENWPKIAETWPKIAETWPKIAENCVHKIDPRNETT